MLKNSRKYFFFLILTLIIVFGIQEHSYAAATCPLSSSLDRKQWQYVETKNNSTGEYSNSTTGSSKVICCETGALQTKQYHCDFFKFIPSKETPKNPDAPKLDEKLDSKISCDLSNGDWEGEGSFTSTSDQTMDDGTTKICCDIRTQGSTTGTTYRCNKYVTKQYKESGYDPSAETPNTDIPADCGILSELEEPIEKVSKMIQIAVPIVLIVLGTIDFAVPVLTNDKEALQKATSKFIKRCIVAIAIFFVPLIVKILLNIYNDATGANASTCGLGKIVINLWR